MHAFERQSSQQTLAQGIAEYYEANPGLAKVRGLSPEAQQFFRCHDAAHVVFGCGNTLNDEAIVKIASIFGTTGGFAVLRGYRLHESRQIYTRLRLSEVVLSILQSVFVIPRTIIRCARQRARWPWENFEQYLHVPLNEIRGRFRIRVAHFRARGDDT